MHYYSLGRWVQGPRGHSTTVDRASRCTQLSPSCDSFQGVSLRNLFSRLSS